MFQYFYFSSRYCFTSGSGWLKLKPEYVDSLSDDLDLIILGGNYGSGARHGGLISHFLLGVAATPANPGDQPTSFLTFGKVVYSVFYQPKRILLKIVKHLLLVAMTTVCSQCLCRKN